MSKLAKKKAPAKKKSSAKKPKLATFEEFSNTVVFKITPILDMKYANLGDQEYKEMDKERLESAIEYIHGYEGEVGDMVKLIKRVKKLLEKNSHEGNKKLQKAVVKALQNR